MFVTLLTTLHQPHYSWHSEIRLRHGAAGYRPQASGSCDPEEPPWPTPPSPNHARTTVTPAVRDALSAVNAEEILDDPDGLEDRPEQPPAATPDSPNPI